MIKKTYIYIDILSDGTPFYVGVGSAARVRLPYRSEEHTAVTENNPGWKRVVYGWTYQRDIACDLEIALIKKYGRRGDGTGTLVNLTRGGVYVHDLIWAEPVKRRHSAACRRAWQTPAAREGLAQRSREAHAVPTNKARHIAAMNEPTCKAAQQAASLHLEHLKREYVRRTGYTGDRRKITKSMLGIA